MSATQNIEGLASGLDVTAIVDAIMEYQHEPVDVMEQEVAFKTQQVSAYQAVLAKFIALQSTMNLLQKKSYFEKSSIDVSDETILTATADGSVSSGTYSLQVLQLAHNHQIASQGFDDVTADTFGTGEIKLSVGDDSITTIDITTANNSLIGIKDAINDADVGVSASIINDGSSSKPYRLLITADATGAQNDIQFEIDLTGGDTINLDTGSFDNPELLSFSNEATSTVSLGETATFEGSSNKIYTFTVGGTGTQTIGTDVITLNWTDGTNSGSIVVNQADTEYEVLLDGATYDGLKLSFGAGDLVAGDTFQVATFTPLLQEATDAKISLGGGSGTGSPIIVTSDSNSFEDVIAGLEFNVRKVTDAGEYVTIGTDMDTNAIRSQISDFIDNYNGVMEFIDDQFSYDEDTTESGVLFADYSLQVMQSSLRFAMTSMISGIKNGYNSLSSIGIRTDSTGSLSIADSSALTKALENDLDGVIKLFTDSGESSSTYVEFLSASSETEPGENYVVRITQAATQGYYQGVEIADPSTSPLTIDSTNNAMILKVDGVNSDEIHLNEGTYSSGEDLANEIQTRINADDNIGNRELKVEWVDLGDTGYIKITQGQYGSGHTIQLKSSISNLAYSTLGLASGSFIDGKDVEGTINGESATGKGQVLEGDEGNTTTDGLRVKVTYSEEDLLTESEATVSVIKGLATKAEEALNNITKSVTGSIARRTTALQSQIDYLQDRIDEYEERLATRREDLYSKFTAMESALAEMQAEGDYLETQLENLSNNWSYNKK